MQSQNTWCDMVWYSLENVLCNTFRTVPLHHYCMDYCMDYVVVAILTQKYQSYYMVNIWQPMFLSTTGIEISLGSYNPQGSRPHIE